MPFPLISAIRHGFFTSLREFVHKVLQWVIDLVKLKKKTWKIKNQQEKQYKQPHKVNNINYKGAQGTSNTSAKNKETEQWDGIKWMPRIPLISPPTRRAATSAASAALAACCDNSFLISAYHFISTFQRKAQCERCRATPRHVHVHVHVQEECSASSFAWKSRRGVRKCSVIVAQSGKRKGRTKETKKKSANCNCLAANLRKCRIIAGQGNRDCTKSEERRAKAQRARQRERKEHGVKLLKSELHVFCAKLAVSGASPALLKRLISA